MNICGFSQTPSPNLSSDEMAALDSLAHIWDIVINLADKGSAVAVMDKPQYEGYRQLQDQAFYTKLLTPIFHESTPRIELIL